MTAQQTTETNYDLDAIAKAVGITASRAKIIIATLTDNFHFDATKVPTNGLVSILTTIVGIQESDKLSVGQAVERYVKDLQQNQKQSTGKTSHAAGNMAESIDNIATGLANQMAPKVVELAIKKLDNAVMQELAKGFELFQSGDCFSQLGNIIDAEIKQVETNDNFQLGGDNILGYFALPSGK